MAIIGTAGRRTDAARITREIYDAMYRIAVETATEWSEGAVVSGGAAVADHLAVRGFNEGAFHRLTLYLPAEFNGKSFTPNPSVQFNPGATLNHYHSSFSRSCGIDSLAELALAIEKGAQVMVRPGFHNRNLEVAGAQSMLAMTFSPSGRRIESDTIETFSPDHPGFSNSKAAGLRDGGTAHTWGECWNAKRKRHVNLARLEAELRTKPTPPPGVGF